MDYIKYSYIALIGWGFWAIGSKLLSRSLNTESLSFWISLWSLILLSLFIFFKKSLIVNIYSFYAIPVGIVSLIAILAFYKALKEGPSSVVIPLTNLYVIFPVLFGILFLKEEITAIRILGIAFAVLGAIFLSL
uniref:EamA domain-containing protein n=1 Tax=candidate division WOR-3 bacterium TaxID=2052148 RepID=A0A7C4X7N6_UNCW3